MTRSETTEDLDGDPCDEREDHCPADFEDDGAVIGANMVFSSPIGVACPEDCPGDLNDNGQVNDVDPGTLLGS